MSPKKKLRTEKSPSRSKPLPYNPSHLRRNWSSLVIVCCVFGAGIYWGMKYPTTPPVNQVACTMEAKLCPDGSYVGRTGPNCAFTACPLQGTKVKNTTLGLHFTIPTSWFVLGQAGIKIDPSYATTAKNFIIGNGNGYSAGYANISITALPKNEADQSSGVHSIEQWKALYEQAGSGVHFKHEEVTLGTISATKMSQIATSYPDTYRYYLFANDTWFFVVSTSLDDAETHDVLNSFSF